MADIPISAHTDGVKAWTSPDSLAASLCLATEIVKTSVVDFREETYYPANSLAEIPGPIRRPADKWAQERLHDG
jgi:hypothetical protein